MALANKIAAAEQKRSASSGQPGKVRPPIVSFTLWSITLVSMPLTIWLAFFYAPTDAVQGEPQRIFYFHVPVSWIGMLAFVIMAGAGVVYLWKKDERWDWIARASAEI